MSRLTKSKTLLLVACLCQVSQAGDHHDHDHSAPPPPSERRTHVSQEELQKLLATPQVGKPESKLPPLPTGVEELSFQEFYQLPVGPRGLEPSTKLLAMNGKRVRIIGYMGKMERANKRQMIFAPMPLQAQPEEYGLCDDIPATHILVTVPGNPDEELPYVSGPMLLIGTLSVGNFAEKNETSFVRMQLELPAQANK